MIPRRFAAALAGIAVAVALAVLTGACTDPLPPAAPTPVAPTTTDSFNGTLAVGGSNTHPFSVAAVGGVNVTLSDVQPGAALGIGVGTPSGAGCTVLGSMTVVPGSAPQLVGTATTTGNFCILVFDVGNLVEPVNYTVTVFHS